MRWEVFEVRKQRQRLLGTLPSGSVSRPRYEQPGCWGCDDRFVVNRRREQEPDHEAWGVAQELEHLAKRGSPFIGVRKCRSRTAQVLDFVSGGTPPLSIRQVNNVHLVIDRRTGLVEVLVSSMLRRDRAQPSSTARPIMPRADVLASTLAGAPIRSGSEYGTTFFDVEWHSVKKERKSW